MAKGALTHANTGRRDPSGHNSACPQLPALPWSSELEVADSGAHEVLLELRCSPRGVWFRCHGDEAALFHRALTSAAGCAQQVCYENRPC